MNEEAIKELTREVAELQRKLEITTRLMVSATQDAAQAREATAALLEVARDRLDARFEELPSHALDRKAFGFFRIVMMMATKGAAVEVRSTDGKWVPAVIASVNKDRWEVEFEFAGDVRQRAHLFCHGWTWRRVDTGMVPVFRGDERLE